MRNNTCISRYNEHNNTMQNEIRAMLGRIDSELDRQEATAKRELAEGQEMTRQIKRQQEAWKKEMAELKRPRISAN